MDSVKLLAVEGLPGLCNDLIFCTPQNASEDNSTVVFFPGDIQNYPEEMEKDPENNPYWKWNLINMALMLKSHYHTSHIIVVKPSRMEQNAYSCYDNFVKCDLYGTPEHGTYRKATPHLEALMNSASQMLIDQYNTQWSWNETKLLLAGFSKGCVVLNQMLHEMIIESDFIKNRVRSIVWLDAGHSGKRCVYITSPSILQKLASFGCILRVEVTPYQVVRRPWVGREEAIFNKILLRFGANVSRHLHFSNSPPSLINHFLLLDQFFTPSVDQSNKSDQCNVDESPT